MTWKRAIRLNGSVAPAERAARAGINTTQRRGQLQGARASYVSRRWLVTPEQAHEFALNTHPVRWQDTHFVGRVGRL